MKFSKSFDRKINRNDNSSPYRRSKSPKSGPHSTEKVRPSLSLVLALNGPGVSSYVSAAPVIFESIRATPTSSTLLKELELTSVSRSFRLLFFERLKVVMFSFRMD